jgi:DNA-binding transcriptional LysR family regulator
MSFHLKHCFIIKAMTPDLVPAIAVFARVAHYASFTRAADELGVSPSALSQTIRTLEKRLGVRLLERSTRRVSVTEIGQRFLQDAEPGLATLTAAIERVNEVRELPTGLLRLNLPKVAFDVLLQPHLVAFMEAFPDITLELHCDNALVDLVGSGFDAGIRLGENLAPEVVAVPLGGRCRLATVAAPSYLKGRTPPKTPEELSQYRCVNVRIANSVYRWEYTNKGRDFEVEIKGSVLTNDGDVLLNAVRAGAGIGCVFEAQVEEDIANGRLVPLLKPWWPGFPGFYLYYSSRIHVPRKLRVFIDFMQQRLNRAA